MREAEAEGSAHLALERVAERLARQEVACASKGTGGEGGGLVDSGGAGVERRAPGATHAGPGQETAAGKACDGRRRAKGESRGE